MLQLASKVEPTNYQFSAKKKNKALRKLRHFFYRHGTLTEETVVAISSIVRDAGFTPRIFVKRNHNFKTRILKQILADKQKNSSVFCT